MKRWILTGLAVIATTPASVFAQVPLVVDMGWLVDGRRYGVGDIVTVVVDEYTAASADRSSSASQERSTEAGLGLNAAGTAVNGSLGSGLGYGSSQRGRDYRQDRLNSEVSVRVTEVEASGHLRIEGTKILTIDEHEQEVTVRGVLRPQDIMANNTIESWRIAEVEVSYGTDGSLAEADKGILSMILGFIIP